MIINNTLTLHSLLLDDHRFLTEPACGASLAALYTGLVSELRQTTSENKTPYQTTRHLVSICDVKNMKLEKVVVIVCGGSGTSREILENFKHKLKINESEP